MRWQSDELKTPSKVVQATTEYDAESDPLAPFLEDCCEEGEDFTVDKAALYAAYVAQCRINGMEKKEILGNKAFSRKLKARGLEDGNSKGRRYWRGLKLREGEQLEGAKQFLTKALNDSGRGAVSSTEIMLQAQAAGISKDLIWQAKKALKLTAEKYGDEWIWAWSGADPDDDLEAARG